jgi:hypothetical protein
MNTDGKNCSFLYLTNRDTRIFVFTNHKHIVQRNKIHTYSNYNVNRLFSINQSKSSQSSQSSQSSYTMRTYLRTTPPSLTPPPAAINVHAKNESKKKCSLRKKTQGTAQQQREGTSQ